MLHALLSAALLAPLANAGAGDGSVRDRSADELVRVLRTLRDPDHAPLDELAPSVAEAGQHVPDLLFDILEQGLVPDRGEGEQVLSIFQRDLILLGLEQMGEQAVHAGLGDRLRAPEEPGARRAAIEVLGAIGGSDDLVNALELARPAPGDAPTYAMSDALRRAAHAILLRDPRAFERLVGLRRILPEELLPPLLEAIGDAGDPRGVEFLAETIFWHDALFQPAVAQLQKVGPSTSERLNEEIAFRLRSDLGSERTERSRTACLALAAIRDLDSVPLLIESLAGEDAGVRANAHWALRELTGLAFAADASRWEHWYRDESGWMQREKARELRRLLSRDVLVVERAIRTIARHPLAREDLSAALRSLAVHGTPQVRVLACRTAGDLGDHGAEEWLVDALDDPATPVAEAALEALRGTTGRDLPADSRAWRNALQL